MSSAKLFQRVIKVKYCYLLFFFKFWSAFNEIFTKMEGLVSGVKIRQRVDFKGQREGRKG